jgi:hypothetical protein
VTLTLPDTPNLCPSRTDISTLHTHTRCACRSLRGTFESVSRQSVQLYMRRVEWMLRRVGERRLKRVKKTEKDEQRERDRGKTTKRHVFIWQQYGILMTGQSRRISRVEISIFLVRHYSQIVREILSNFAHCSPKL